MIRIYWVVLSLTILVACTNNNHQSTSEQGQENLTQVHVPAFQKILDSAQLRGSVLIFDSVSDSAYSNNFKWANQGKLPASTFKIANSIIGLETGVIKDAETVFKWNGEKRALKNWEQDLVLKDAFQFSCVPCYQSVAREIGTQRMKNYLEKLNYGAMQFDSTSIDQFWLSGESKINQFEQIDFLERLDQSLLPISNRTEMILKRIMLMEDTELYTIYGKTGWAVRDSIDNGWFVGTLHAKGRRYYFATNVEPLAPFNMDLFPVLRKEVTYRAFEQLEVLQRGG